jgi:polysaccharide export outer membrane protein
MTRFFRWLVTLPTVTLLLWSLSVSPIQAQNPDSKDFIVGPEDVMEVQVWDNKDLNQIVFVGPDGKASLPLAGQIQVAGKTVQELQDYLAAVYAKTIKSAAVTVIIKEIRSRPVYFVGGFGKPGVMQLTRDLTLIQAVALVGGVTPGADGERGFVLRKEKVIPVDFTKLMQTGDVSQNLKLEPGDSVVAPLADLVYVQGEVKTPGPVKYMQDLTVLMAISQVGGFTPRAAGGRVDILRGKGEKKERIRVDVDKVSRAPEDNPDVLLKPNDIVLVPQRLF